METASLSKSYKEKMWRHLAEYKTSALAIQTNGYWKKNKKEYPHILPLDIGQANILKPYRDEFWAWFGTENIKLHSDFHHLSSSQAMCFNLFFPFLAEQGKFLQQLRNIFTIDGIVREARFEVILNHQDSTNFDFCVAADSKTLFEVKLTEVAFAGAASNETYSSKFERVYSPALRENFKAEFCSPELFLRNYQLMRNVWNLKADGRDTLVFLVPKANSSLQRDLDFLDSSLSDQIRPRVSVVFLEDVVTKIEDVMPEDAVKMREHFIEFRRKYIPHQHQPVEARATD